MKRGRKIKYTKENFWDFVDKKEPNECWPWLGPKDPNGYGVCSTKIVEDGTNFYSHRKAYILIKGSIPLDKPFICHTCDNPSCCNPEHLFAGTNNDNMKDMVGKDRQAKGDYLKIFSTNSYRQ